MPMAAFLTGAKNQKSARPTSESRLKGTERWGDHLWSLKVSSESHGATLMASHYGFNQRRKSTWETVWLLFSPLYFLSTCYCNNYCNNNNKGM